MSALLGLVCLAHLLVKRVVIDSPSPEVVDIQDTTLVNGIPDIAVKDEGTTLENTGAHEDGPLPATVPKACQRPVYVKPANYDVLKTLAESRRIVWGDRQVLVKLPQTYLQYYDNSAEDDSSVVASNRAIVQYQSLVRWTTDARVKHTAPVLIQMPASVSDVGETCTDCPMEEPAGSNTVDEVIGVKDTAPQELSVVLYQPIVKWENESAAVKGTASLQVSKTALWLIDALVFIPRGFHVTTIPSSGLDRLALVLYKFKENPTVDLPSALDRSDVETSADRLAIVLYQPVVRWNIKSTLEHTLACVVKDPEAVVALMDLLLAALVVAATEAAVTTVEVDNSILRELLDEDAVENDVKGTMVLTVTEASIDQVISGATGKGDKGPSDREDTTAKEKTSIPKLDIVEVLRDRFRGNLERYQQSANEGRSLTEVTPQHPSSPGTPTPGSRASKKSRRRNLGSADTDAPHASTENKENIKVTGSPTPLTPGSRRWRKQEAAAAAAAGIPRPKPPPGPTPPHPNSRRNRKLRRMAAAMTTASSSGDLASN